MEQIVQSNKSHLKLEKVLVSDNKEIEEAFFKYLTIRIHAITMIEFVGCGITPNFLKALTSFLLEHHNSVDTLAIRYNTNQTLDICDVLSKFLLADSNLKTLDLSNNQTLTTESVEVLLHSLRRNQTLETLLLTNCNLNYLGEQAWCERRNLLDNLKQNCFLQQIDIA